MPAWLVSGLHAAAPMARWIAGPLPDRPRRVLAPGGVTVAVLGGRLASGIRVGVLVAAGAVLTALLETQGAVLG